MRSTDQSRHAGGATADDGVTEVQFVDSHEAYLRASRLRSAAFNDMVLEPIVRAVRAAVRQVRAHFREQSTVRALSELSDHTLHDIGLHREDIWRVARELVEQELAAAAAAEAPGVREAAQVEVLEVPTRAANDDAAVPTIDRLAS